MKKNTKDKRISRRARIRAKVIGTKERPRLSVYRSNTNIYAQLIDDTNGKTIVAVDGRSVKNKSKLERAREVGLNIAKLASDKKITKVVFDRSGYIYTGSIRALADGGREGGLEF